MRDACEVIAEVRRECRLTQTQLFLGNLFDNAIEAASHADSRWLTLNIGDEKGHGIDLENVKETVEQYHGAMELADKDNVFKVRVKLYI
ncbi:MAG: GHKL domain-containing protein [Eubacteriales bacterium]|nr:GHKL domain-containing protein [Eubacteriales bacterium]